MYQKEFAERLAAQPKTKNYGRLTVNMYYNFKSEILKVVPRAAFYPRPKVDSAIVQLVPRAPPFKVAEREVFGKLVKVLFGQRRKKIRNSMSNNYKLFG